MTHEKNGILHINVISSWKKQIAQYKFKGNILSSDDEGVGDV